MEGVALTIMGIFGLTGNILALIVLTRPQMRSLPINLILIGTFFSKQHFLILASWPPPATNACPSGLKRHSRGGRCIQGEFMQTTHTSIPQLVFIIEIFPILNITSFFNDKVISQAYVIEKNIFCMLKNYKHTRSIKVP